MLKASRKAINMIEVLMAVVIMGFLIIPTIDLMSSMVASQADFAGNLKAKQIKLNVTERITSNIREGSYIYPDGASLTIPTMTSSTSVTVGNQTVAVLVPTFNADGTVNYSNSTGKTSFKGVAYSIIPESTWNSGSSGEYVLVETIFNTQLSVDTEDTLDLTESATVDWASGSSYALADNLMPANQTIMGSTAFDIDDNIITFGLVPEGTTTYFPSSSGTAQVDDTPYISSVVIQNIR